MSFIEEAASSEYVATKLRCLGRRRTTYLRTFTSQSGYEEIIDRRPLIDWNGSSRRGPFITRSWNNTRSSFITRSQAVLMMTEEEMQEMKSIANQQKLQAPSPGHQHKQTISVETQMEV